MEVIVTVEFRFSDGYKYTSLYKGREVTVSPAFGWHGWYVSYKDRDGTGRTYMSPVMEADIVQGLLREGYKPLFMKWCMEESREYGFNPFVADVTRLCAYAPHVYITHDLDDDLIKVGTSGHLPNRLRSLYAKKGHRFEMLGIMQGGHSAERAICQRFKEHLVIGREWFRPHQEIFDFVSEYTFDPGEAVKP